MECWSGREHFCSGLCGSSRYLGRGLQPMLLDIPNQADLAEHPNGVPVEVDFVPAQSVPGRNRMRVVVVVPALAKGKERNQEVVRRVVLRLETSRTPHVGGRIHQPGAMQTDNDAEKHTPQNVLQATEREQRDSKKNLRDPVPPIYENVY